MERNKTCGIYKITNTKNGKTYIGQSVNIEGRIREHFRKLKNNAHINQHLQYAYNLYGRDAFRWEIVEVCPPEELNDREISWIQKTNSFGDCGYNLTAGGEGNLGWTPSEESLDKIRVPVMRLNDRTVYKSISDAESANNIPHCNISKCCRGEYTYAGKYNDERAVWAFMSDLPSDDTLDFYIQQRLSCAMEFERKTTAKTVICLNNGKIFEHLQLAADYAGLKNISSISGAASGYNFSAGHHPLTNERLAWMYYDEYLAASNDFIEERLSLAIVRKPHPNSVSVVCINDGNVFSSIEKAAQYYKIDGTIIGACRKGTLHYASTPKTGQKLMFVAPDNFIDEMRNGQDYVDKYLKSLRRLGENAPNTKPVRCITTGAIFPTVRAAATECGISATSIVRCCKKQQKTCRNQTTGQIYEWEYIPKSA